MCRCELTTILLCNDVILSSYVDTLACAELADPANGNVELSAGTDIGSVATYTCNDGYILGGSSTRTCEEGGLWSGEAPTCEGNNQFL